MNYATWISTLLCCSKPTAMRQWVSWNIQNRLDMSSDIEAYTAISSCEHFELQFHTTININFEASSFFVLLTRSTCRSNYAVQLRKSLYKRHAYTAWRNSSCEVCNWTCRKTVTEAHCSKTHEWVCERHKVVSELKNYVAVSNVFWFTACLKNESKTDNHVMDHFRRGHIDM